MCADKRASQNKLDTDFGWFADAIHFGDYPAHIKVTKVGLGFKACLLSFSHASQPVLVGEATCQLWAWMVQLSTLLVHNRPHTHTCDFPGQIHAGCAFLTLHSFHPSILPSFRSLATTTTTTLQAKYLPSFTDAEKALLKRSYDYMGLTIYTAKYAAQVPDNPNGWWIKTTDPNGK
jgi:hypothetical protein